MEYLGVIITVIIFGILLAFGKIGEVLEAINKNLFAIAKKQRNL